MIFSELYSAYYNTVARILTAAIEQPLEKRELRKIIEQTAFGESILNIEPALCGERWQLLHKDGTTSLRHTPTMPLTTLQKRWLKAISLDARIRLFTDDFPVLDDVEPLFTADDFHVFDKYTDGDAFEDAAYIRNFRVILDALRNRYPLSIDAVTPNGNEKHYCVMPEYLEYSEKDDKFRLIASGDRFGKTINLGRIAVCERFEGAFSLPQQQNVQPHTQTLELELTDERNALERVLLHFAHFEKEAERLDENRYLLRMQYDKNDETELVIRILSFGPLVRVISPQSFVELIRQRLIRQMQYGDAFPQAPCQTDSISSESHICTNNQKEKAEI